MTFLQRYQTLFRRPVPRALRFPGYLVRRFRQRLLHPILQGVHTDVQVFRNGLNRPVATTDHLRQGLLFEALGIRRFLHALDIL